jgi:hypothetical protein
MKPYREIHARDLHSFPLKDEMASFGYVLVREVIPRGDVERVCADIVPIMDAAGWLLPGHDPMDCLANPEATCGDKDPAFWDVHKQVLKLESLQTFIHHPALRHLMEQFAGPRVLVHPKFVMRMVFPNCERIRHRIHQDHEGVQGDSESFTVWTPFQDCPAERGALQVMEASHGYGLQRDPAFGHVSRATARGGDWVVGQINAGDVLLFHSLTVHEPSLNVSKQMRLSIDCRFQDCERVFHPSNIVPTGGWDWETIYENWQSDEFQYYWKRLPLRFKPTRPELAELIKTGEPPEMRPKYATILSLLEAQMAEEQPASLWVG